MHLYEETLTSEVVYKGGIITVCKDVALLENGVKANRDVVKHPGGVCIVPLTESGDIICVKQFRYPFATVMLEVPAGKLEWGEDHQECGKRELLEETGMTCDLFQYLGYMTPTPAYCTEKIHMYMATGLHSKAQNLDCDEFLDVVRIPFSKAVEMVMDGEIVDGKTQIAILKCSYLLNNVKYN